jgi:hypothetical protein
LAVWSFHALVALLPTIALFNAQPWSFFLQDISERVDAAFNSTGYSLVSDNEHIIFLHPELRKAVEAQAAKLGPEQGESEVQPAEGHQQQQATEQQQQQQQDNQQQPKQQQASTAEATKPGKRSGDPGQ